MANDVIPPIGLSGLLGGDMVARSQGEHDAINDREYPGTREMCCVCSEPTGHAGAGEDSIFRIAAVAFPLSPDGESCNVFPGEEVGPLCCGCNRRMDDCGLLVEE